MTERKGRTPLGTVVYTATTTKQSVTGIPSSGLIYLAIHLAETAAVGAGKEIRVAINGAPAALDGDNGFLLDESHELVLDGHIVYSVEYIRESGQASDVEFSLLGLY